MKKSYGSRILPAIALLLALTVRPAFSAALDFGFEPPTDATDAALPAALRDLAERIVPVYKDEDADEFLTNLAALQMAAGDPAAAEDTLVSLQWRLRGEGRSPAVGRAMVYNIYVQARAIEETDNVPFTKAYRKAFQDTLDNLDDLDAYTLESSFAAPTRPLRDTLQRALDRQRGKTAISLDDALELVHAWFAFESFRDSGDVARLLLGEDKEKRYVLEDVAIPVAKDATIAATLVRPRAKVGETLPTLLEFTLDRSSRDAREAAAHGYASMLALARIAGQQKFRPRAPFETDGEDARAVIGWIAKQPWSDGRVGVQGVRYGGFVAWAAAKKPPAALKAIATSDPMAPGIDVPMQDRIVHNSAYRWVYEVLAPPNDTVANNAAFWRRIDEDWYRSGRSYREFPSLRARPSAVFRSWLNHPSYDRFWQKWVPFRDEFAKIDIPVLTITGYYSAGETGALYYFTEHRRHAPNADHALLIGPFDEQAVRRGAPSSVRGLAVDTVARVDPITARYEWFDYALRGAKRPALLSANVNYELAGANEWRHEASLDAPESKSVRFYLGTAKAGAPHALVTQKPSAPLSLTDTVDLRNRSDAGWRPARELAVAALQPREGMVFATQPFAGGVDLAGHLRGVLDFTINKYDVDLVMTLYELRADGTYVKLFDPDYAFRASYARDPVQRRLLAAGVRQQLPFQSERIIGRRLEPGSRLVLALGIDKRADRQINYGGTHDVSEESIEDAGAPLRISWHEGSFIEVSAP